MTKQDIIRKLSSRRLWMSMVDEIAKLKRIVTGRGICSEWDEETFTELVDHVDVS